MPKIAGICIEVKFICFTAFPIELITPIRALFHTKEKGSRMKGDVRNLGKEVHSISAYSIIIPVSCIIRIQCCIRQETILVIVVKRTALVVIEHPPIETTLFLRHRIGMATDRQGGSSGNMNEEPDMTSVRWSDPMWLRMWALNKENALAYFMLSPFYVKSCNNELIKMQNLDASLLKTLTGLEYDLDPASSSADGSGVYIIRKRWRTSETQAVVRSIYYIVEGDVFQAPSANVILANRISTMMHFLKNSFAEMNTAKEFTQRGTHEWINKSDNILTQHESKNIATGERKAVRQVLFDVFDKNRRIVQASEKKEADANAMNSVIDTDDPTTTMETMPSG